MYRLRQKELVYRSGGGQRVRRAQQRAGERQNGRAIQSMLCKKCKIKKDDKISKKSIKERKKTESTATEK